jgi:hypothetical protein
MDSAVAISEKGRSKGLGTLSADRAVGGAAVEPVSDVGLAAHMEGLRVALASVVSGLDPDCLTGRDAARLYRGFAALEHLAVAGKTLLAPRIDTSGFWREDGHRDASSLLATLEGVSTGEARRTLVNGRRLDELPATEDALRQGQLSAPKVTELTGAGVLDPSHEAELLKGAGDEPLAKVKERCRRSRAASATADPLAATRRIRAERHFSSWIDPEGAFCYQGKDTADRGARILDHLGHAATCLRKSRRRAAESAGGATTDPTPERALRADAFFALLTQQNVDPGESDPGSAHDQRIRPQARPSSKGQAGRRSGGSVAPAECACRQRGVPGGPSDDSMDIITRPPTCTMVVRSDIDALFRGHTLPGEICEIDGLGPSPVPMARDLANDSVLRVVFHKAGDIRAVSHLGRTINATLRTALVFRDRTCVIPGCEVDIGLEIDHVREFASGGPTELDNLALLCHHHHYLKTYENWILERIGTDADGTARWRFEPQPPFGREPDLGIDSPEGRQQWNRRNE